MEVQNTIASLKTAWQFSSAELAILFPHEDTISATVCYSATTEKLNQQGTSREVEEDIHVSRRWRKMKSVTLVDVVLTPLKSGGEFSVRTQDLKCQKY